ncbi:transposase [Geoglobus acetivorans]|uniref:Transposase n=1 Tax=Geoglobus acetivorans TaxID=565033 RepID=A0ABZ3H5X6_GEOAI|nr:transposase [Geoglobus acetivorans]
MKRIVARYTKLKAIPVLKIAITSMFFSIRISHVIREIRQRKELREFMEIREEDVPEESHIYAFLSKFSLNGFVNMILRTLNAITKRRARNSKLIVDCTDVSVDVNWFRRRVKQKDLQGKDYKWGYSAKGKFIGMKLTLVLEYPSLKPLLFLLHPANRHEARIFREVMEELRRRRIIRREDTVIMDKGFYAYRNHLVGINEYRIVPLIFPRSNFDIERLDGLLSYPLSIFDSKNLKKEMKLFKSLKAKLMNLLQRWESFKSVRSVIEDVFKLAKSFSLRKLHRYTMRSVYKFAALNVLLIGIVVAFGFREKKVLQKLAEG